MVEQKENFNIVIYSGGRIHCSRIMLYSSPLDETKFCNIFKYNSVSLFASSVITLVPSASPRILSCIQKQNTFRSNIILLEKNSLKIISNLSMFVEKNKLLISSLKIYLVKHLNIFIKSLGFSQVLIRLQVCRTVVCQGEWRCVQVHKMVVFQGELPFSIDVKGG